MNFTCRIYHIYSQCLEHLLRMHVIFKIHGKLMMKDVQDVLIFKNCFKYDLPISLPNPSLPTTS